MKGQYSGCDCVGMWETLTLRCSALLCCVKLFQMCGFFLDVSLSGN